MSCAVVTKAIAPVFSRAGGSTQADELLFGMAVELLPSEEDGLCRVRCTWGLEGFVPSSSLQCTGTAAKEWVSFGKMAVRSPWLDVMEGPSFEGRRIAEIPRGGLVHPLGEKNAEGWLPVGLPDGQKGYAKSSNLMPCLMGHQNQQQEALREALAATALSYLGTQYRKGGRTPLGIDCAGLVSMAYLLNGVVLQREPAFYEGGPLRRIERGDLQMGDVLYFNGHAALYLGDDRYVHSTSQDGSDGVVINSLDEASPFFREDYAGRLSDCASLF